MTTKRKASQKNKTKRKPYKSHRYNSRSQLWDKVGGAIKSGAIHAGQVIKEGAVSTGRYVKKEYDEYSANAKKLSEKKNRALAFARKYGLKIDRDDHNRFWLDPTHYIYVDVDDQESVNAAIRQIRGRVRRIPEPKLSYRGTW